MESKLKDILNRALSELKQVENMQALNEFKVKYLGKQGELTGILRGMREVPA